MRVCGFAAWRKRKGLYDVSWGRVGEGEKGGGEEEESKDKVLGNFFEKIWVCTHISDLEGEKN